MKNPTKLFVLAVLIFAVGNVKAQKQNDDAMRAMAAYMTPGDPQKMMSASQGDWKAETTFWMDPSQPPQKAEAKVHNEMIMGGRYLTTRYDGNMMGMPFEGLGTMGYDNGKKMYVSTWVDNMGTGISYMEGKPSADGKSIELRGKSFDPMVGKEVMMREVMTFVDDNHQKMEMYTSPSEKGKEVKTMEINLSR